MTKVFYGKAGSTYSLNKLGTDKFRFTASRGASATFSQELSQKEAHDLIEGLIRAFSSEPTKPDTSRLDALNKAIKEYCASRQKNVEDIDKEISYRGLKTREAWLKDLLGADYAEEVLAGKLSIGEALSTDEDEEADVKELEGAGPDTSSPGSGDSLRA